MEEPIWEHSPNSTSMDWEWDETSFTDLDRREFIKALSFTRAPSYHPIFSPYMSRLLIRVEIKRQFFLWFWNFAHAHVNLQSNESRNPKNQR